MKKFLKNNGLWMILLGVICIPQTAYSVGYEVTEQNAKATGLAGAFTAWADNPSAVYYNPAGVAQADKPEAVLGLTMIFPQARMVNNNNREINRADQFYIPNFFFDTPLGETDFFFGLGVYTPYGLASEWDRSGITRYSSLKAELKTIFVTPVLAWKPIPELSIGAGGSFIDSELEMTSKFPSFLFSEADPLVRLKGKDQNWGWTAGMLAHPSENLSLGFSYRSATVLRYKGTYDVTGMSAITQAVAGVPGQSNFHTDFRTSLPLPQRYSIGIGYKLLPNWRMEFDYERTLWSAVTNLDVHVDDEKNLISQDQHVKKDWRDTNSFKLGTELLLFESLALRVGGLYFQTPVPDSTLDPMVPDVDRFAYTLGVGYQIGGFNMDLGYMDVFSKTRSVKNDSLEAHGDPNVKAAGLTPGRDRYENRCYMVVLSISHRF